MNKEGPGSLRQKVFDWAKQAYGTEPEYLWMQFPDYAVLRNGEGKWYGIVMNVPKSKFGFGSEDSVDVLNVKADLFLIDALIAEPGFFRGYHMNKNQWLSIFLDGSVPEETVRRLLAESYERTQKRKRKTT